MATTQSLVNKVLRGLRQFGLLIDSGTTTITDDYLLMILQLVNEAKEECEDVGWPWEALRATITVTLAQGTTEYTLTSAGDADVDTTARSRLLYETSDTYGATVEGFYQSSSSLPMVFDVTTSSEYRLHERTQEQIERLHFQDNDEQQKPYYFSMYQSGSSLKMKVWPTPDQAYTLKVRVYTPQAELASTSIDSTTLSIPERPVWMLALLKANAERGSELGRPDSELYKAYMDALGAATQNEMSPADQTVFLDR